MKNPPDLSLSDSPTIPKRYELLPPFIQKNPDFMGRMDVLKTLCSQLCDEAPKQLYNHRVALYGLGAVRKTQIAIEYVVTHQNDYNRVF